MRTLNLRYLHTGQLRLAVAVSVALLAASVAGVAFADAADAHVPPPVDSPYPGTIELAVTATDTSQGIFRVHEVIPVHAGKLILLYPKWIPGEHAPAGPIGRLAGLEITANGKRLMWHRYKYDVYAFRVNVPQGVTRLDVRFEYLSGRGSHVQMTNKMLDLEWNDVSLYPAGYYSRDIIFAPSVTLPKGWEFGTALARASHSGDTWTFKPTTYNTLVDSPMYAGKYFSLINLNPDGKVPVHMNLVADSPKDLAITTQELHGYRSLVTQAYKLFDSHHYKHYDFLFSLSGQMSGFGGLEHHQSSEDKAGPDYFTNRAGNAPFRFLLAHEYVHSWNGKFRRPADLWTPNFNVPMGDSMLWVYEGLTQYYSTILTARAGLWTPEQFREHLALVAANHDVARPGYQWRTLQDTTNAPIIHSRGMPYTSWQLGEEYYYGGSLMWLAVDCKIRALTHDRKSLDTFAKDFLGIDNGGLVTRTYTFKDIVNALNSVVKYDWARFLRSRLDAFNPPLLSGLKASGWKLLFTGKESQLERELGAFTGVPMFGSASAYSIGLTLTNNGQITDVRWNGPAFKAGIGSKGTVVAIDGQHYSNAALNRAIKVAKGSQQPIKLLIKYLGDYRSVAVDYHGGLKYPHLVRIKGAPNYLAQIIKAK